MKKIMLFFLLSLIFFGSTSSVFAETSYLYYYGEWCPHCANVDDYMTGVDGYSRVNIEKKEVYYNQENAKSMSDDAERLWVKWGGVPFLIIRDDENETYLVGDGPIIEYFIPILWEPKPNNRKTIVLSILWLLVIVISAWFIFWGKKS